MSVTTTVGLDFMLGSITGAARLENMISEAVSGGAVKGLSGAAKETQKKLEKAYGQAYVNSIRLGAKEESKQLEALFSSRQDKIKRAAAMQARMESKLDDIKDRADRGRDAASLRRRIADTQRIIKTQQEGQDRLIVEMNAAQKDRLDLLDQGMQQAATSFGSKMETGADKFGNLMQSALSAENLNVGDLVKNIGGALKNAAPSMTKFGASQSSKGGVMGGMGKAIGKLGAAAGVIAGAAAAIGAIVALFAAAYGQTKEFNKAILEGSSSIDLMGGAMVSSGATLQKELGNVRNEAIKVSLSYRIAAEDVLKFANEMNSAGLQYKDMAMVFGNMGVAMEKAVHWTQTFGVGGAEIGQMINQMTEDMGRSLTSINEGFASIYGAANLSSMGVASFFTSVNEATSGMALMNFRMEDTVELLLAMEKILGGDMAKETLTGLRGKYQDMGFQERHKTSMIAGSAGREVYGKVADRLGAGYAKDLGATAKSKGMDTSEGILGKILKSDGSLNSEFLGSVKGQDLGSLQNQLKDLGPEFEVLARRLGDMSQLQRGTVGGRGGTGRQAAGLAGLDEAGTLAYSMVSALGDRAIGDMEGVDRMAFEDQTGISGKEFDVYQEIFNRKAGEMADANEKGSGKDGRFTMSDIAKVIADGDLLSPSDKAALEAAAASADTEMEKIAKNQLIQTTSILQTLKNQVVSLLNTMNGFLETAAWWLSLGSGSDENVRRKEASEATQDIAAAKDSLAAEQKALADKGDFTRAAEFEKRGEHLDKAMEAANLGSRSGAHTDISKMKRELMAGEGLSADVLGLAGVKGGSGQRWSTTEGTGVGRADSLMYQGTSTTMALPAAGYESAPKTLTGDSHSMSVQEIMALGEWRRNTPEILGMAAPAAQGTWGAEAQDLTSPLGKSLYEWQGGPQYDHGFNPDAPWEYRTGGASHGPDFGKPEGSVWSGGTRTTDGSAMHSELDFGGGAYGDLLGPSLMGLMGDSEPLDPVVLDSVLEYVRSGTLTQEAELPKQTTDLDVIAGAVTSMVRQGKEEATFNALTGLADVGVEGMTTKSMRASMAQALSSGALSGAAALKAKTDFATYTGQAYDDFIYRGKGSHIGTIHPINGQDIVGVLPENMSKLGGGGVSIGNLTIYESGDPNKTFAMVKAAIKAARA